MNAEVAILAGGQGTRLLSRSGDLPKPMVAVAGRPLLEHQIACCREAGFRRLALLVHFRHERIADYFGDGRRFGVELRYCVEAEPRGTAGALRDALPELAPTFLVLYGDTFFNVDLRHLWQRHHQAGADATLLLHPNDHPHDSDLVEIDRSGRVHALWPSPHPPDVDRANLVNAALYVVQRDALAGFIPALGKSDLARHTFSAMLAAGRHLHGHVSAEYIKDMGTPERLDRVENDLARGLPERLSQRQLRCAVFLDRDGTLNEEVDHLCRVEQLRLLDGAAAAVRRLNRSGTLAVVVSNQPVLARGQLTEPGLAAIHARLDTLLGQDGAYVDRIYHCPHHPDAGFAGEVTALKIPCDCRKPATGMIDAACRDHAIDRTRSWLIGDSSTDIEAGRRAGLKTILVRTGHGGRDGKHALTDCHVTDDLAEAVEWVLHGHAQALQRLAPAALRCLAGARLVLVGGLSRSGKSTAAQLLQQTLAALQRRAHVVSLDGWLRPVEQRPEGRGVLARFDIDGAVADIAAVVHSQVHRTVAWPVHDRATRRVKAGPSQSIAADDLLIVEGVPALLHPALRQLAQLRLHIDIDEAERLRRFTSDYRWRGADESAIAALHAAREADETPPVLDAAQHADLRLTLWSGA
jgi:histidinol-phosphate phosphatase family protein